MFSEIFLFEWKSGLRRPAIYIYAAALFALTFVCFANGALPAGTREHYNSPYLIALWCAGMSMLMMLVSSPVMGTPLYRDIEHNTHSYYLSYPVAKTGYFWGRFLGAFACLLLVSCAIPAGIWLGSIAGPALGWQESSFYGPNQWSYYLHPYLMIALPNLVFTSGFFFGLVALTRNVKVIYTGGLVLFLGYFLSIFFLKQTHNEALINLADPFGVTNIRNLSDSAGDFLQNNTLFPVTGAFLLNRLTWAGLGLAFLGYAYLRFNFTRFFNGKEVKTKAVAVMEDAGQKRLMPVQGHYDRRYNRHTLFALFKIELNNLTRDPYFRIIISCGLVFLLFIFWTGSNTNGIPDLPRTVMFLQIDPFFTFLFILIVFYTGETLHRDRTTRYAFIGDALPVPDWVLGGSKLLALLFLGCCFSLLPLLIGLPIQLAKGFYHFNFPLYGMYILTIILPKLLEMVVFAYTVHVVVNHKFAAHAVAVFTWIGIFLLRDSGIFDYNLLLYSYTPYYFVSDMDGLGHMAKPVYWFTAYWLLDGGLLIVLASLFYYRGVLSSFKERLKLVPQRFTPGVKIVTGLLFAAFLVAGTYLYYNVSYLNAYLTKGETDQRAVIYERTLKRYAGLPLPQITRIKMNADLFPERQLALISARMTVVNTNTLPVSEFLVDANGLSAYTLLQDGREVPYRCPLTYRRGMFNFFRPERDTADFRLYRLRAELAPGDSAVLEVRSEIAHRGFTNWSYATDLLRNGTCLTSFLPSFGYDQGDELSDPYDRRKYGLPPRLVVSVADKGDAGKLQAGMNWNLLNLEVTLSTSGDQTAIAPGALVRQWRRKGRNYFHYVQDRPGVYGAFPILSARYAERKDSVWLDKTHRVGIHLYYHPEHAANLGRFLAAYRDGLHYFSSAFGPYPYRDIRLAETSVYSRTRGAAATLDTYNDLFAWNAAPAGPGQDDYVYLETARALAQQWWGFQVAPNDGAGSGVISEGLSRYSVLKLAEKKYGMGRMRQLLQDQAGPYRYYLALREHMNKEEQPLATSDESFVTEGKAAVVLYGLADLIGEDRVNVALQDFRRSYAFKSVPPFAGSNDLYAFLKKQVPADKQYYLEDSWQKMTVYHNRLVAINAVPSGKNNDYLVTLDIGVAKVYRDGRGRETPAKNMEDYIDIGVFEKNASPLYLQKYKLTAGQHVIRLAVHGKPDYAGIDPFGKLIDDNPGDNLMSF
jgi:hypothetical protein